ncbi:MAG TPA: aryl-sulfate sulfotransferase [Candidatus Acidoferrum sp.]|nr:aryl-sulfate sulfotransferase [Candidatus Acidoferrum sp.]
MKTSLGSLLCAGVVAGIGLAGSDARAQLPPDFPQFTVATYVTNQVAPGYIFIEITDNSTNGGYYELMMNNDGTPNWYLAVTNHSYDFKPLPNGYLHYAPFYHTHSWTGGGDVTHPILDNNYDLVETVVAGNGYAADGHDFQMLPNGHVLLMGYYKSEMDLSGIISGAYPSALVAAGVIQELDAQRNVVWQWRTWDHFNFATYYALEFGLPQFQALARNAVMDSWHLTTVVLDTDGNLLMANYPVDVQKINRQTGAVMWRLGGFGNQFSFVGESPAVAVTHFGGHDVSRLANGDIMIFNNADQQATRSSAIYEYSLDEVHKVATKVWSYTPPTNYYSWHYGSAQRMANGNTFIGWGGADIIPGIGGTTNQAVPACTEVTASGQKVYELWFNNPLTYSYRAYRVIYPPATLTTNSLQSFLVAGNDADYSDVGVVIEVNSINTTGGGYNQVVVTRAPYAPVYPQFNGKAPLVLPVRVSLSEYGIDSMGATMDFSQSSFGFSNPTNLTVYYRSTTGQGLFVPLPTSYNPVTQTLSATVSVTAQSGDFGEFIFGYPDIAEVPYPPILNAVQNYLGPQTQEIVAPLQAPTGAVYSVNQQLPVWMSWSPVGFAGWYAIQVATDPSFTNLVVNVPYLTEAFYVWNSPGANTTYYYRVQTSNNGGQGAWAVGEFQTGPPFLQLASPNGGEAWRRGLTYFVKWNGNLPENVYVDLYKGGSFLMNLATNVPNPGTYNVPCTNSYKWPIPFGLTPGPDYSIKVTSVTNSGTFAMSAQTFSIVDPPSIISGSMTSLPNGSIQFGVSAPGAATATVQVATNVASTNLATKWQVLQVLPVTNGITTCTDTMTANAPERFYRVRLP